MLTLLIFTIIAIIFYTKFSKKVPILMYHRIANIPGDRNSLPSEKFEQQLEYLYKSGFSTINMDQLYAHYTSGTKLPKKSVVLTFDDGYADNLYTAIPILKKYNMIGNVFPITNWIGKENKWENFGKAPTHTMTEQELLKWLKEGNYIGSHTCNHPFLSKCTKEELFSELKTSKEYLEILLKTNVNCICYPYGNLNSDTINIAKQCDYKTGLAIFDNAPLWNFNLLALPRIPIPSNQKMWEFKLKVSKIHLVFCLLRKVERNLKKLFR